MTALSRGNVSAVKKTSSTAEAPVWKAYLAIRLDGSAKINAATDNAKRLGRKRSIPLVRSSSNVWVALATPTRGQEDGAAVLKNVRQYWEQLSTNERQQILFLDDPELVKQLYKLNWSLLCVGLMQRHLKTSSRTDTTSEKTYELLEAMEFMDISTGILTVKTELAEDTGRLFSLVGNVLSGFLTSVHVLTESSFNKLFVSESETINTWANYQRLIAMLVEQLILKSYISHLEKQAAERMEQLLLEVSLEDYNPRVSAGKIPSRNKKKAKRKKKQKLSLHHVPDSRQRDDSEVVVGDETNDKNALHSACESTTEPSDDDQAEKIESKPISSLGLNPNASVFQPQVAPLAPEVGEARNPYAGKRKLDEYIVRMPIEDVAVDDGNIFESKGPNGEVSDDEDDDPDYDSDHQRWRKQRRYEDDAELEWQLQQVYASTSSLFGWDFTNQRELAPPGGNLPWSTSTLWRTAPKEVVRYFSPGVGDAFPVFSDPRFLPPPVHPPSRYYFNPGPPPLLPPGMELPPPQFGQEFPMVVSDFSDVQFYPSLQLNDQVQETQD